MYGLDGPAAKKIKLEEPQPTATPGGALAHVAPPTTAAGLPPPPPFYLTPQQMSMFKYLQQNQVSRLTSAVTVFHYSVCRQ